MSNNLKVLIGLSIVMSGVCDANAATITLTDIFSFSQPAGASNPVTDTLSFAQFNPSLGTLTNVDFSLRSSISVAIVPPPPSPNVAALVVPISSTGISIASALNNGPYNFTNVSGLVGGLTTADYTGSGNISVFLTLGSLVFPTPGFTWTGNGTGQGLTLVYRYTPPHATPLPATLPLFATGLVGLGLFGWLRNRKSRAGVAV